MFDKKPKSENRVCVKTILCAVSRNYFSEHLQWSRKQWLKWGTMTNFKPQRFKAELKTDLRWCAHDVWALFVLRYLSCIMHVLITEVSALLVHVVRGQLLCCGQCWSLLPPFFCASPTPLLGAAGYYFSCCLCAAEPVGARTKLQVQPLQTEQSKRGWGLLGSERCLMCFKLCTGNAAPCDLKGGS